MGSLEGREDSGEEGYSRHKKEREGRKIPGIAGREVSPAWPNKGRRKRNALTEELSSAGVSIFLPFKENRGVLACIPLSKCAS